jgi:hypothetical protein
MKLTSAAIDGAVRWHRLRRTGAEVRRIGVFMIDRTVV